jgi:zinc protease
VTSPRPVERALPPPPTALHSFRFPAFGRHRLACGLEILVARLAGLPLLTLELLFPAGAQHDPADAAGLAALTGGLLDEGTVRRSSMEIASTIERLGGQLASGADWDAGFVAAGVLSRDLDAALGLVAEVATEPSFPPAEVERVRRLRLAEILRRRHSPSTIADDLLMRVIYAGTPYASPLIGEAESLAPLERRRLVDFFEHHYDLRHATLVAVGDLEPARLLAAVEATFDGVTGRGSGQAPPDPLIRPPALGGVVVHVHDRPGGAQTELRLGHAGISRSDPDYTAFAVLNTLLGGKFTSRINLNLRERHGYTYGAASRFAARLGPGPFVVSAAVATPFAGAAAREVLDELRRIRDQVVDPEELEDTRNYLLGVFPYTLQTVDDLANRMETLAIHHLPDDYYDRYAERLAAVTRGDLQAVARRHLRPSELAIIAVGPATELVPQLEALGPLTVHAPHERPEPLLVAAEADTRPQL